MHEARMCKSWCPQCTHEAQLRTLEENGHDQEEVLQSIAKLYSPEAQLYTAKGAGVTYSTMSSVTALDSQFDTQVPFTASSTLNAMKLADNDGLSERPSKWVECTSAPPPEAAAHYCDRHFRMLGLSGAYKLDDFHSMALTQNSDKPYTPTEIYGLQHESNQNVFGVSYPVSFATVGLIGACSVADQHQRVRIPVRGAGRAGRIARGVCTAQQAAITTDQRTDLEHVRMAFEDLMSSSHRQKDDRARKLKLEEQNWLGARARIIQAQCKGWQARKQVLSLQREKLTRQQAEEQRLWQEMRKPRPFRSVSKMMANVRKAVLQDLTAHSASTGIAQYSIEDKSELAEEPSKDEFQLERCRRLSRTEQHSLMSSIVAMSRTGHTNEEANSDDYDLEMNAKEIHDNGARSLTLEVMDLIKESNMDFDKQQDHTMELASPKLLESENDGGTVWSEIGSHAESRGKPTGVSERVQEICASCLPTKPSRFVERARQRIVEQRRQERLDDLCVENSKGASGEEADVMGSFMATLGQVNSVAQVTTWLRSALLQEPHDGIIEPISDSMARVRVRDEYIANCQLWKVKPNSKALTCFEAKKDCTVSTKLKAVYDFGHAHLGDRGVACVLHALLVDPRQEDVSLQACALHGACASVIAAFLELHPRLRHVDLSDNYFSYEAGELLLEALTRRSRGQSVDMSASGADGKMETAKVLPKLQEVTVDLGGTALAWGRGGITVGPPSGNLWAGHGRYAPSSYEHLRCELDKTHKVQYSPAHSPRHKSAFQAHCSRRPSPRAVTPRSKGNTLRDFGNLLPKLPSAQLAG